MFFSASLINVEFTDNEPIRFDKHYALLKKSYQQCGNMW